MALRSPPIGTDRTSFTTSDGIEKPTNRDRSHFFVRENEKTTKNKKTEMLSPAAQLTHAVKQIVDDESVAGLLDRTETQFQKACSSETCMHQSIAAHRTDKTGQIAKCEFRR